MRVGKATVVVGHKLGEAVKFFDCANAGVQRTVRDCALRASGASLFGQPVAAGRLNLYFQDDVVNLSVEFERFLSFNALKQAIQAALLSKPRVTYWGPEDALYESTIWLDGETEVELSRVYKGKGADQPIRAYISDISAERPPNPADAP